MNSPPAWMPEPGAPARRAGTKGDRRHAWARQHLNGPTDNGQHWLLARRSLKDRADLAHFICYTPDHVTLLTTALGGWCSVAIEETFQTSKGETRLDHYQVRHQHRQLIDHEGPNRAKLVSLNMQINLALDNSRYQISDGS